MLYYWGTELTLIDLLLTLDLLLHEQGEQALAVLLEHGADPNIALGTTGETPLDDRCSWTPRRPGQAAAGARSRCDPSEPGRQERTGLARSDPQLR